MPIFPCTSWQVDERAEGLFIAGTPMPDLQDPQTDVETLGR
jgi:hypothetical protein